MLRLRLKFRKSLRTEKKFVFYINLAFTLDLSLILNLKLSFLFVFQLSQPLVTQSEVVADFMDDDLPDFLFYLLLRLTD